MNLSLIYKPFKLIERIALAISRKRRFDKLKHTVGFNLKLGHIDSLELLELIKNDGITAPVIFDVGSNIGTWTILAKSILPDAVVHAFEPLKQHNVTFIENCSKLTKITLNEFCLGNENKLAVINVSGFSDSSSLLEATALEYDHFKIKKVAEETVAIKRPEDLINAGALPTPDILKLDVQGFELEVLKGMGTILASVKYVVCEVSFKEYYKGQPLFLEIADYLSKYNIRLFALGNNTPLGTELNQIDVLFKAC